MLHYAGLPDRIIHIGSGSPAYTTACTSISYANKARYQEFICPYRQQEIHPIMECLWVLAGVDPPKSVRYTVYTVNNRYTV